MDINGSFFAEYFILLAIALVMIVLSISRYQQHARLSRFIILTNLVAIFVAVSKTLEMYGMDNLNPTLATIFAFVGYILNPLCIFFFIMMSGEVKKAKTAWLLLIPWLISLVVYSLMFIPGAREQVVYYIVEGNKTVWHGGWMRFASHITSGFYLAVVLYISFGKISSKHIGHGVTIIACAVIVLAAVIVESFFNEAGRIHLLSTTAALCTIIYYLYLYVERASVDPLTGLFNRETYYHDVYKMNRSITGVIQFDMNGLKYINDTYGHLEGDRALWQIGHLINLSMKRNMYVYRLGGDEYLVIAINSSEEQIKEVVDKFKENLKETNYHCSIGYAFRKDRQQKYEDLYKEAERSMYKDKEEFYKNASFDRRKS